MSVRVWYQLFVLVFCLVVGDQFFKIVARYLTPQTAIHAEKVSVLYTQKPGWIERTKDMPLSEASKKLFSSQNGVFTALLLVFILGLFHRNRFSFTSVKSFLPYAFISAAILSLWIDNLGVWSPESSEIRWFHLEGPVKLHLSWTEVYFFLGTLMFILHLRKEQVVPPPPMGG